MREIIRTSLVALSVAALALSLTALSTTDVLAQARQQQMAPAQPPAQAAPPQQQIVLTDKQVESALAAAREMDPITAKLSEDSRPDPKMIAQLDAIAKKNGFANYREYSTVVDNISLVLGGFDPQTKKYVGPETVIKTQIAQVQADKKMSPKDKQDALADLNDALKTPPPAVQNKGNIDVVAKYYDRLADTLGANDQQ
jgi:hypothetical protein